MHDPITLAVRQKENGLRVQIDIASISGLLSDMALRDDPYLNAASGVSQLRRNGADVLLDNSLAGRMRDAVAQHGSVMPEAEVSLSKVIELDVVDDVDFFAEDNSKALATIQLLDFKALIGGLFEDKFLLENVRRFVPIIGSDNGGVCLMLGVQLSVQGARLIGLEGPGDLGDLLKRTRAILRQHRNAFIKNSHVGVIGHEME